MNLIIGVADVGAAGAEELEEAGTDELEGIGAGRLEEAGQQEKVVVIVLIPVENFVCVSGVTVDVT